MIIRSLIPAALALLAASGAVFAQPPDCPQSFPGGQPPALVNPRLEPRTTLLCNDACQWRLHSGSPAICVLFCLMLRS